jgi:hypothetical protein
MVKRAPARKRPRARRSITLPVQRIVDESIVDENRLHSMTRDGRGRSLDECRFYDNSLEEFRLSQAVCGSDALRMFQVELP